MCTAFTHEHRNYKPEVVSSCLSQMSWLYSRQRCSAICKTPEANTERPLQELCCTAGGRFKGTGCIFLSWCDLKQKKRLFQNFLRSQKVLKQQTHRYLTACSVSGFMPCCCFRRFWTLNLTHNQCSQRNFKDVREIRRNHSISAGLWFLHISVTLTRLIINFLNQSSSKLPMCYKKM